MRTLTIDISDFEYNKLGIKTDQLSFIDFVDVVSRQTLVKSVELAERYGLADMTMNEISAAVKAVRNNNHIAQRTI